MSPKGPKKQVRLTYTSSTARRGFSLAELVVSIGILLLMLSLVGQVYSLTVRSTGQATALTAVNQQLRIFEQRLREDLADVQPERSVMVIQGNAVNAFWTVDQREANPAGNPAAGYVHTPDPLREDAKGNLVLPRADLLMFFTSHQGRSFTDPRVTSTLQQVTYGHADLGEYVPNSASTRACDRYTFVPGPTAFPADSNGYPLPTKVSPVPAQEWHLARRAVLLLPGSPPPRPCDIIVNYLDEAALLQGATDFIGAAPPPNVSFPPPPEDCWYDTFELSVLSPWSSRTNCPAVAPWYLPPIFGDQTMAYADQRKPYARSQLDPTPPPLFADRLSAYGLPNCASFKVEWTLDPRSSFVGGRLDGVREVLWFDPGRSTSGTRTTPDVDPLAPLSAAISELANGTDAASEAAAAKLRSLLGEQTYHHSDGTNYSLSGRFHTAAMSIDPDPNNIGTTWPPLATGAGAAANLVAFGGARPQCVAAPGAADNSCPPGYQRDFTQLVPDDLFPSALRITIDLFDKEGRLDRPIRHVMVIPVGK